MRPSHEGKPHIAAKQRVARWLRAVVTHGAWGGMLEGCKVRIEMPLALTRNGDPVIWHDEPWAAVRTPRSRELRNKGLWCPYRLDIGVTKPGAIVLGIKIDNRFSVREEKVAAVMAVTALRHGSLPRVRVRAGDAA